LKLENVCPDVRAGTPTQNARDPRLRSNGFRLAQAAAPSRRQNENVVARRVPGRNEVSSMSADTVRRRLEGRHDEYSSHVVSLPRDYEPTVDLAVFLDPIAVKRQYLGEYPWPVHLEES
jgi:hypothetical protein